LRRLRRQDPKTRREIQGPGGLFDNLESTPDLGYALEGEWKGCYAVHIGRDRYRVIWELLPPVEDYEGDPGDEVVPVSRRARSMGAGLDFAVGTVSATFHRFRDRKPAHIGSQDDPNP